MLADAWCSSGGGGAGLGDRPVLLGGHSPRPLPGLGTAQPDAGARGLAGGGQPACSCWPLPTAPRWGQGAGGSGDSTPFPGCRDLCCPPAHRAQRGPWAGGHVLGCCSPEDAHGVTLMPSSEAKGPDVPAARLRPLGPWGGGALPGVRCWALTQAKVFSSRFLFLSHH